MFKHKLKIVIVTASLLGNSLFSLELDGLMNNFGGSSSNKALQVLMSGGSGISNVNVNDFFTDSKMPFELDCKPTFDGNFQSLDDICAAYKNTNGQASGLLSKLGSGITLGQCKIKANGSNSCRNQTLDKLCGMLKGNDTKTLFGVASSQMKSKENMVYTGGDIYLSGNQCEAPGEKELWDKIKYGQKTNRQTQNDYLSASKVATKKEAGGNTAFWRPGKLHLYETCIKDALSKGKNNPEEVCQGEFYSLPQTRIEAEEQIHIASTTSLRDGTSGLSKKVSDVGQIIKSSANPSCTQVVDGNCVEAGYVNNVKNKIDAMAKAEQQDKIKKTEEEMATFQEHVKVATMPKYEITYPTQEVLDGIHPEQKEDFVVAANKQIHQKALFNSAIHNLTELKKELVEVSFRKAQLNEKIFYPNVAMEEANKIMNSGF